MNKKYQKVIIFQYGKVASSTIMTSQDGMGCQTIQDKYDKYLIKTHNHEVAKDILSKHKNVLIINIVRLPITRNISAFYQNIDRYAPDYNNITMDNLIKIYDKAYSIKHTTDWMNSFFNMFNINIDNFNFDTKNKYNIFSRKGNDILLLRYEDIKYTFSKILPKYGIKVSGKCNASESKPYSISIRNFLKNYKITKNEKQKIINNTILNKYYTKNEIQQHIKKFE